MVDCIGDVRGRSGGRAVSGEGGKGEYSGDGRDGGDGGVEAGEVG